MIAPAALPWRAIAEELDREGYVLLPALVAGPDLPAGFAGWCRALRPHLAAIAARWDAAALPDAAAEPVIERQALGTGSSVLLCQAGTVQAILPLALTVLLSRPGVDFRGGQLVLVEQRPRMQSRPMVVTLAQGDALLYCATARPVGGSRGPYRVQVRQATSRVHAGVRVSVQVRFQRADA